MSTTTTAAPTRSSDAAVTAVAAIVLIAFTGFSAWVTYEEGYFGFLTLARRERWGMQVLLDLCIAACFALGWLRADARRRGINPWPFLLATIPSGSIAILTYTVLRGPLTRNRTQIPS
jgi:hypothetical protein